MTLNKFMHPRNPYRVPPDFKQLTIDYPEFRKHVKQDLSGKIKLDFKDHGAVMALTKCLLLKDFGISIDIPPDRLVPTLPLRMNYLLWIEDMLKASKRTSSVSGIDIGAGASCIYPLLAAKRYNWKMLATEIDEESLKYAHQNVEKNNLSQLITVREVRGGKILCGVIDEEETYDFCMCNPPFFSDESELEMEGKSRTEHRNPPRNHRTGVCVELVAPGGETSFIQHIITDSKLIGSRIRVYTVMVGHKSNVNKVKSLLRAVRPVGMNTSEFCQGRTTRWGIAWTFCPDVLLATPRNKPTQDRPPFRYILPGPTSLDLVRQQVIHLLTQLKVNTDVIEDKEDSFGMDLKAYKNTWSHSRRKRREERRKGEHRVSSTSESNCLLDPSRDESQQANTCCPMEVSVDPCGSKEEFPSSSTDMTAPAVSSDEDENPSKRVRLDSNSSPSTAMEHEDIPTRACLLHGILTLTNLDDDICLAVSFMDGTGGRECANQVLQYLKNNIK